MFEAMWNEEGSADEVIDSKRLKQITDTVGAPLAGAHFDNGSEVNDIFEFDRATARGSPYGIFE